MVAFENATVLRFYQPNFHLKHDQILTRRLAATSDLNKIEIGELQVDVETGNRAWSWYTVGFGDSIRGALKVGGLKTVGFPSNSDKFWMISVTSPF